MQVGFLSFSCFEIFLILKDNDNYLKEIEIMAELEMMKERFAKLLLGEDMSGSGNGVCTAVTISNSITNLYGNYSINICNG